MLASLRTKFLLPTFYVFFTVISKNAKSHVFLKSEKKRKIRILEHWPRSRPRTNITGDWRPRGGGRM